MIRAELVIKYNIFIMKPRGYPLLLVISIDQENISSQLFYSLKNDTSLHHLLLRMIVSVVVQSEYDGDTGGGNLTDLGHDTVHETGWSKVIDQVEQRQ